MDRLVRSMWNGEVKIITGIRRCGKSVLLFDLFYDYLTEQGVSDEQVIRISLDRRRFYKYRNPIALCEYLETLLQKNKDKKFYLFIDEVQMTSTAVDKVNGEIEVTVYDKASQVMGRAA